MNSIDSFDTIESFEGHPIKGFFLFFFVSFFKFVANYGQGYVQIRSQGALSSTNVPPKKISITSHEEPEFIANIVRCKVPPDWLRARKRFLFYGESS